MSYLCLYTHKMALLSFMSDYGGEKYKPGRRIMKGVIHCIYFSIFQIWSSEYITYVCDSCSVMSDSLQPHWL